MTKTITITDIADLRAGDVATYTQEGHEFTGEVWADKYGGLRVGGAVVRFGAGETSNYTPFVSATREVPDLPTKQGSVIANVDTLFGHYDWAMLADPGDDAGVSWVVASADGYRWVRPDEITSWTPCTVEVQS